MKARHMLAPLLAIGLLAGCTVVPAATPAAVTKRVAAQPREGTPVVLDAGTVVATGPLTSVDGLTTGDVAVTALGDGEFEVVISHWSSPVDADIIANLSSEPFTEESYCASGFMTLVLDHLALGPTVTSAINFTDITLGNPDFLDTLVLTLNDANASRTGCFYPVLATAPLTWTMPDLRPDIHVVDHGVTGGATGPVALDDGEPGSYEVQPDDVLEEIAARFGLTVAELFYLNPARGKGQQQLAFTGELFNLSKSGR